MKKKVALLIFNPFTNDSRVLKEAITLSNNNYIVEVIAHHDKNLEKTETYKNFLVKRVAYLDRSVTKNKFKKLNAYITYIKETAAYCKNFDILHCNDLDTLPIALIIKKLYKKNIKVIYDAHEYETETNGLHGIQKSITKILENFLIKYVDKVITVSDAIAEEYVKLYKIDKPSLVLNTPKYKEITKKNLFRGILHIQEEESIFLYQGSLNYGRGIEILIDTFKTMDKSKNILILMGYGEMEKEIKEASLKYDSIYFYPAVEPDILLDYTSSADFGIATIEDTCLSYRYCLPNKMFEYIMAEVPIIVSNLPEMKKIVDSYKVGVIAKNNSKEGLEAAILEARKLNKKELNTNIKKTRNIFNWEEQEKVLLTTYRDL